MKNHSLKHFLFSVDVNAIVKKLEFHSVIPVGISCQALIVQVYLPYKLSLIHSISEFSHNLYRV